MRNDDHGLAQLFSDAQEQGVNLLLGAAVQVAGGFVGKEDGGIHGQGAGYGHPLLLSAGEFRRFVRQTGTQAYQLQQFIGPGTGPGLLLPAYQKRNHHILAGRKLRQQVMGLKDKADAAVPEGRQVPGSQREHGRAVYQQGAAVRRKERSQYLEKRGLSGAGSAHDGHDFSAGDLKINPFQHLYGAKRLPDILGFYNHFHYLCTIYKDRNILAKAQTHKPGPAASVLALSGASSPL